MRARWALSGAACGVAATLVAEAIGYALAVKALARKVMG